MVAFVKQIVCDMTSVQEKFHEQMLKAFALSGKRLAEKKTGKSLLTFPVNWLPELGSNQRPAD